jgi:hypothetical protein
LRNFTQHIVLSGKFCGGLDLWRGRRQLLALD